MNAAKRQQQKWLKNPKNQKGSRAQALIAAANQCDNPLLEIDNSLHHFSVGELDLQLTCHRWPQVEEDCQKWMIDLTEENMKTYYETSSQGWNRSNKLKEFKHNTSRILLLKSVTTNQLIAFVNFRFEVGGIDTECVVYCYELQVAATHQRSGVGQHLMSVLLAIGRAFRMQKVMLTVFKRNAIAMDFYTKALNYRIDRSSPSRCQQMADYEILSLKIEINHK